MIWLALLFLTIGSECIGGVFIPPRSWLAFIFFLIGSLSLGFSLWKSTHVNNQKTRLKMMLANSLMILVSASVLQFLFLHFYFWIAPHYHAVPILSAPLDILLSAIGHETTRHGEFVYLQTFRTVLSVSVTFEKLGVPSLCNFFLIVWMTLVWLRQKHWARLLLELIAILGVFAIFRVTILILLFTDWHNLAVFWNPIWIGISFLPLVAIFAYFYPTKRIENFLEIPTFSVTKQHLIRYGIMCLCFLSIFLSLGTEDPGTAKSGKVLIDEFHSNWEWTTLPFNKENYGKKTTYNYYCFRTWLNHYYHVSVNTDQELTQELLSQYATLIIKTPTSAFSETELSTIQQFVRGGGGLFLIGDHTNLYGMTTYINPVSERFGITFLPDATFELNSGAASVYQPPPLFAHPTVHHIQKFKFMTSCTLSAPLLRSRTIMRGSKLGREGADYSHINFFGNIKADINDEYGIFIQATARKYGKGRVVAFSDSTVFSNFSMFFEGKPELAIGIMDFLNRTNSTTYKVVTIVLLTGSALGLLLILLEFKRNPLSAPLSITLTSLVLLFAIFIGNGVSGGLNAFNYRKPRPHTDYTRVCFDQSISDYRLPDIIESKVSDAEFCFDAFYTSVQRLGHYPALARTIKSAIDLSQVVVVINPRKLLDERELSQIQRFLQKGGSLLVLEKSASHTYYTQQFQRLTDQIREEIPISNKMRPHNAFKIVKTKMGNGHIVIVFGAAQLSMRSMGPTYSNPTEDQKSNHQLAFFLFEEVLNLPTHGEKYEE